MEGLELLPPVTRPGKIVCIGLNYRAHAEEQGAEPPETPTFFAKFRERARARRARQCALPSWSEQGGLRGRGGVRDQDRCKDVPGERGAWTTSPATRSSTTCPRATTSSRRRSGCPARPSTAPRHAGPALVTPDEAGAHDAIEIELTLNGERDAEELDRRPRALDPALVAYLSQLMTLEPGDVVATGTPAGVGSLRDPKVWLKPGDEVVISLAAARRARDPRWPSPVDWSTLAADRFGEQVGVAACGPDRHASRRARDRTSASSETDAAVRRHAHVGDRAVAAPLELLGEPDDPAEQLQAARRRPARPGRPSSEASGSPLRW